MTNPKTVTDDPGDAQDAQLIEMFGALTAHAAGRLTSWATNPAFRRRVNARVRARLYDCGPQLDQAA